jgi:hypothetical protein
MPKTYTAAHHVFMAFNLILSEDIKINNSDQSVLYVDKVILLGVKLVKIQEVVNNVLKVTLYKIKNVK